MTKVSKIYLFKNEPGGDSGHVVKILCPSGTRVAVDQHLFDVETAKACQEIRSTAIGTLSHSLYEGQEVTYGSLLAEIAGDAQPVVVPSVDLGKPGDEMPMPKRVSGNQNGKPVVSREAARLLESMNVDPASIGSALITTSIVRQKCGIAESPEKNISTLLDMNGPIAALSSHKIYEIAALKGGAGGSFLSMVGAEVVGYSLRREHLGFFENKILDLVVFESARLIADFPNLNASYRAPDELVYHRQVVPGVAFNGGGRLVTYAVRPSALSDVEAVRADIIEGFKKYVQNILTQKDCAGTTYTITDLSTAGAEFVLPLVPSSQSCIIGITRNATSGYNAYLAFDHRVTDGFEAANFLNRLCKRVRKMIPAGPACEYCGERPDLQDRPTMLLSLRDADGGTHFCCRRCWN